MTQLRSRNRFLVEIDVASLLASESVRKNQRRKNQQEVSQLQRHKPQALC
eukprot:COSAG02_NODE_36232_length_457_cov_0.994413_2_plen_49_part_01